MIFLLQLDLYKFVLVTKNREVFLHNACVVCPPLATYVKNCYSLPSRLFIIGDSELKSSEGTTQGDPIAMAIYAVAVIPLMMMILDITNDLPDKKRKWSRTLMTFLLVALCVT